MLSFFADSSAHCFSTRVICVLVGWYFVKEGFEELGFGGILLFYRFLVLVDEVDELFDFVDAVVLVLELG